MPPRNDEFPVIVEPGPNVAEMLMSDQWKWTESIEPADGWVDLLPLVDVDGGAVRGTWRTEGEALVLVAGGPAGLMLPVEPHGSFELRSRFYRQQNNGGAVKFWLPVGTGQASLVLNGQNSRHGIERQ